MLTLVLPNLGKMPWILSIFIFRCWRLSSRLKKVQFCCTTCLRTHRYYYKVSKGNMPLSRTEQKESQYEILPQKIFFPTAVDTSLLLASIQAKT
jgi:hypothetical protein